MSKEELASIIPVSPPTVNRKINPLAHSNEVGFPELYDPYRLDNQLKTFTPVGTAMAIVAAVK
jgi:hypothetical protein